MRILNIMLAHGLGGVETMALRYHEALKAAGTTVLSAGPRNGVLGKALKGPDFIPLSTLISHDPFTASRLRRIAADFRPDIILTHGNRATGIALLPFLGTADKTVQVVHNFRHKRQVTRLKAAIAVSQPVRDSLAAAHPTLAVVTVDNFAPLSAHAVKPAPAGAPVLGTLGRLHVNKGLDTVLQAVARLHEEGVPLRLKIGGDGPLKEELTQLIAELGLNGHVEFAGWIGDTGAYLSGLDLFICSSRVEPFGLVVIESMAAGAAVVATDIDGPRQILREGELGYLCRKEDPAALAAAIRHALGNWPETLKKAEAAQAYALSHFTLQAGQTRLAQALEQIVPFMAKKA